MYCGNLQHIVAARGNARVGRVVKRKPAEVILTGYEFLQAGWR